MGAPRLLCTLGLHRYGPLQGDGAGTYRVCARCDRLKEDHTAARVPGSTDGDLRTLPPGDSGGFGASGGFAGD